MREILFRGKFVDSGKWIYGDLVQWPDGEKEIIAHDGTTEGIKFTIIPETVGQYTGFKDRNGKEIYEGDIVGKGQGEIYWDPKHSQFRVRWHERVFRHVKGSAGEPLFSNSGIAWEVIGNIHDNPELVNLAVKDSVINTMNTHLDPAAKAEQEPTNEQATESAAQDQAMEVDTEEKGEE